MSNWFSKKIQESNITSKIRETTSSSQQWISETIEKSELTQKLSNETKKITEKIEESTAYETMQNKLANAIINEFSNTIHQKEEYYKAKPDTYPSPENIDLLIKNCALKNAAISGGASLLPGPWGMIAVVPEIAKVMRNQMELVYDIGAAHGKSNEINKELLLAIFLTAMGTGGAGLVVMHGGKILVKRSSLQIFQKVVTLLAGKITQTALKSTISKFIPLVGAVFMGWISKKLTESVGQKAKEIFAQEIINLNENLLESPVDIELKNLGESKE